MVRWILARMTYKDLLLRGPTFYLRITPLATSFHHALLVILAVSTRIHRTAFIISPQEILFRLHHPTALTLTLTFFCFTVLANHLQAALKVFCQFQLRATNAFSFRDASFATSMRLALWLRS